MSNVHLLDLISGISSGLDCVSTAVSGHHRRVGIGVALVSFGMGMPESAASDLLMAGLLHDVGAFATTVSLGGLDFDADLTEHARIGHKLIRWHPSLDRASRIVRFHHTPWSRLREKHGDEAEDVRLMANILNLVDRADVLAHAGNSVFDRRRVRSVVGTYSDAFYAPEAVAAFMDVSADNAFWEAIENGQDSMRDIMRGRLADTVISQDELLRFSHFFAHIIDFRSRHTATHSQGVAETAAFLAQLAGMSEKDQGRMRLAGNLHDIGKLGVPSYLLDKPSQLNAKEYKAIQEHMKTGETVLRQIPGLEDITVWACQHHERLNGKGYPNGLTAESLPLGSRILAVADVYTAISEDRPYRSGMPRGEVISVLGSMGAEQDLDPDIVALAVDNFDRLDAVRKTAQQQALVEFERFATE